jgi:hypothetical protein
MMKTELRDLSDGFRCRNLPRDFRYVLRELIFSKNGRPCWTILELFMFLVWLTWPLYLPPQHRLSLQIQRAMPLSLSIGAVVADAKYKRDEGGPQNPDIYQAIAYGTVLQCPDVYLLYPKTEIDSERDIVVLNSPIVVKTRRVDISSSQAVENAESLAEAIATEKQLLAPDLKMA